MSFGLQGGRALLNFISVEVCVTQGEGHAFRQILNTNNHLLTVNGRLQRSIT